MKKLILICMLCLPAVAAAQWYNFTPGAQGTIQTQNALGQNFATPGVSNGQINYTPLEALQNGTFSYGGNTPLSTYLSQAYTLLVTVSSLLAVVFLVVGGVRYMLSEAFTDITKAKKQMWSAMWGLVIILGSFLILYSINPNLLNFSLLIPPVAQTPSGFSPVTSGVSTGNNNSLSCPASCPSGYFCDSTTSGRCANNVYKNITTNIPGCSGAGGQWTVDIGTQYCNLPQYSTQATCEAKGYTWATGGISSFLSSNHCLTGLQSAPL